MASVLSKARTVPAVLYGRIFCSARHLCRSPLHGELQGGPHSTHRQPTQVLKCARKLIPFWFWVLGFGYGSPFSVLHTDTYRESVHVQAAVKSKHLTATLHFLYLVHQVQEVSVEVMRVLISRPHHQDRPAVAVEAAQVYLPGRVLLSDHVHLLRKHLLDSRTRNAIRCRGPTRGAALVRGLHFDATA